MKNTAFLIILTFLVFISCDHDNKEYCKELSPSCELSKGYAMAKIIKCDSNDLDAYGNPLHEMNWYAYVAATRMLIPTTFIHIDNNDLEFAGTKNSLVLRHIQASHDTIKDFSFHDIYAVDIVVLCTDGHFHSELAYNGEFITRYHAN